MNAGLAELRALLTTSADPHLDDERLAAVVTAEAMGEDIEAVFAQELAHVEQCVTCAEAYSALFELTALAMADMSAAAAQVSPQAIYLAMLRQDTDMTLDPQIMQEVVTAVSLLFDRPPTTTEAFDHGLTGRSDRFDQPVEKTLLAVMRQNLAALSAFLHGTAAALWGQVLDVQTAAAESGQRLQLRPGRTALIPTLSSRESGDEWQVLSRRVGQLMPLHVDARARRSSPLACTLTVRTDRPGLVDPAGRRVQIRYGDVQVTAVTDAQGVAAFVNIPIAALAVLDLMIEE
ncbi:MAG: hypothetical protein KDE48_10805 [Anaerolineales bacterium]|nr:hypothetical protein [Anaerolineales bacterium]